MAGSYNKFKVRDVDAIFVPTGSGGSGATIFPNMAAFPSAAANPGMFAIDSSTPGGGQGTLYCALSGNWCVISILAPAV